jgi:hypothetical protein
VRSASVSRSRGMLAGVGEPVQPVRGRDHGCTIRRAAGDPLGDGFVGDRLPFKPGTAPRRASQLRISWPPLLPSRSISARSGAGQPTSPRPRGRAPCDQSVMRPVSSVPAVRGPRWRAGPRSVPGRERMNRDEAADRVTAARRRQRRRPIDVDGHDGRISSGVRKCRAPRSRPRLDLVGVGEIDPAVEARLEQCPAQSGAPEQTRGNAHETGPPAGRWVRLGEPGEGQHVVMAKFWR